MKIRIRKYNKQDKAYLRHLEEMLRISARIGTLTLGSINRGVAPVKRPPRNRGEADRKTRNGRRSEGKLDWGLREANRKKKYKPGNARQRVPARSINDGKDDKRGADGIARGTVEESAG